MTPVSQNKSISDYYLGILQHLSSERKRDLITKLSQTINEIEPKSTPSLQSLFGKYECEESADEIIASLRNSRIFNRNIESL